MLRTRLRTYISPSYWWSISNWIGGTLTPHTWRKYFPVYPWLRHPHSLAPERPRTKRWRRWLIARRTQWNPPTSITLPNRVGLRHCIYAWQQAGGNCPPLTTGMVHACCFLCVSPAAYNARITGTEAITAPFLGRNTSTPLHSITTGARSVFWLHMHPPSLGLP